MKILPFRGKETEHSVNGKNFRFAKQKTVPLREQVENLDMIKDRLSYEEKMKLLLMI